MNRIPPGRFLCALPALLAAVVSGCSSQIVLRHSERVASESAKLVAEVTVPDRPGIVLRVFREREIVEERETWRERAAVDSPDRISKSGLPPSARVASTVGWEPSGHADSSGPIGLVLLAIYGVIFPVAWLVEAVEYLVDAATFDDQRTVIRNVRKTRERSVTATIEPAGGEFVLDLGPQPESGYEIDSETLRRLGPDVVVRDRKLSVAIHLHSGR